MFWRRLCEAQNKFGVMLLRHGALATSEWLMHDGSTFGFCGNAQSCALTANEGLPEALDKIPRLDTEVQRKNDWRPSIYMLKSGL